MISPLVPAQVLGYRQLVMGLTSAQALPLQHRRHLEDARSSRERTRGIPGVSAAEWVMSTAYCVRAVLQLHDFRAGGQALQPTEPSQELHDIPVEGCRWIRGEKRLRTRLTHAGQQW